METFYGLITWVLFSLKTPFGLKFRDFFKNSRSTEFFRQTDILDVGELTLDVAEQTVGETTRRRNDRLPLSLA